MTQRTIVIVNREFKEFMHSMNWSDLDNFGLRLSRGIVEGLSTGCSMREALRKSLGRVQTGFFRANRVNRQVFADDFLKRLERSGWELALRSIEDLLREFRVYAERDLAQDLVKDVVDEARLRAFLQTFLAGRGERSFREVPSGRGKTDILLISPDGEEIIEVKIWRGEEYFREGLEELEEYLRTQNLRKGYYVILDCSLENDFVNQRGHEWVEEVRGKRIHVIIITVRSVPPSKIRRARRQLSS